MAGISKKKVTNKNGKVTLRYVITYRDILGKQHAVGNYKKKSDAQKDLYKYQNTQCENKNLTVEMLINSYIALCKRKNRAKKTLEDYNYAKKNLEKFSEIKISKLTSANWQEIIYFVRDNVSIYAAISCFRLLRAAMKQSIKDGVITTNTFQGVENVEAPPINHNHFDTEEIIKLLSICKTHFGEYYAMFFTFIGTGMREGEIFGLKKENIDFKKNIIKVCSQFTGGEFKNTTKTKKLREVFLFPTLAEVLKTHINEDKSNSDLVFHNKKGNFLNPSNVRQRFWIKLLKKAGYPDNYARMHDLRGSNTDLAIVLGLSITFAQDQLGHTSPLTTLKNYNKTNDIMRRDGINKFESVFKKCEPNVSQRKNSNIIQFPKKQA